MMLNSEEVNQLIEQSINEFSDTFLKYPNIILTEEDARCFLYNIILKKHPFFSTLYPTEDNSSSIPLHTEIRWYGVDNKLKKRSDIVVINPMGLVTRNQGVVKVQSKGFSFNDYFAIIEIKMRRINGKTDNKYISDITEDVNKLKELTSEGSRFNSIENPNYFLLCLDKKNNIENLVRNHPVILESNTKTTYLFR